MVDLLERPSQLTYHARVGMSCDPTLGTQHHIDGALDHGAHSSGAHQPGGSPSYRSGLEANVGVHASLSGIRLHDLRHFYASGLIAAGCDVVTVQRALGHAKATTTLATYSHLWPDAADRTRAAAAELYRSSRGLPADSTSVDAVASP